MRKTWKLGVVLGLAILAVGCFETKQDCSLNPDGSGKVTYEITMQDMSAMMAAMTGAGGEGGAPPQVDVKSAVRQILDQSGGVDAWKDVTFSKTEDNRIKFKGTAYFKSIEKLKLHPAGGTHITFAKDDKGGLVLTLQGDDKDKPEVKAPAQMTEDQIAAKIKEGRARFVQTKAMMAVFMNTLKIDITFHVPGTVAEASCFKKGDGGTLQLVIDGAKMLEAMDKVAADEAIMRELVTAGESLEGGPRTALIMNEKIFGEKAPVRARMTGDLKPLFDYKAEMEPAKKDYPEMLKRLGLDQVKVQTPSDFGPDSLPGGGKPRGEGEPVRKGDAKPEPAAKPAGGGTI
jgi:hypothetical protein